jgi:DNA mismatch repair protein MutL
MQRFLRMDTMALSTDVAHRIRRLSPRVVNKIAAGEVIERPASAVKELLENSIDALATRIEIDVENGGADLIRVVDNGEGMQPDDLPLAVASHATSKICEAEDLFAVKTMGFRGEALASIAEVARLRIRSRQAGQPAGAELEVNLGDVQPVRPCGCPEGTSIEIRDLFAGTPVRRKFLKSSATEFSYICDHFTRVALAHPRLAMTLRHNGKVVHDLPACDRLADRIEMLFGSELARQLIWVEGSHGESRLWGAVGSPSLNKPTRKGQYLFLNGRFIQDRSLQHALGEAFRGLIMVGRYPVAFLFIELTPDLVDVNVHPTKIEVRFRDPQSLYRLMLSTLRNKFLGMNLDSQLDLSRAVAHGGQLHPVDAERQKQVQQELAAWAKQQLEAWQPGEEESESESGGRSQESGVRGQEVEDERSSIPDAPSIRDASQESAVNAPLAQLPAIVHSLTELAADAPCGEGAELRAMQIHDCYLVVASPDGLQVIDQHALHERIMYERLRERVLNHSLEVQRLLIPTVVEFPQKEAGLLLDHAGDLAELGIQIADFGGGSIALTAYPKLMTRAAPEDVLTGVIELLESTSKQVTRRDLIDSLLHMMACKSAIKAGQRLAPEEIESLLAQRHLVDDSHHCPHGRPTALTLSRNELDRQFGRLGAG